MNRKIYHIHTESKFIHDSERFQCHSFDNKIIFAGDGDDIKNKFTDSIIIIKKESESIELIIDTTKDADLIVLYKLESFNTELLKCLPTERKVFLRLFGYELYGLQRDKYISNETRKLFFPIRKNQSIIRNFKNLIHQYYRKPIKFDEEEQKNLYKKIDRLLLVNEYEYEELKKYFYVPELLKIAFHKKHRKLNINHPKREIIIVGNSKHLWNNHIDILKRMKHIKSINNYHLFMFFSYGVEGDYTRTVRKLSKSFARLTLQEEFLSMSDFLKIYADASALVINSYRQHALGNIFTAIFSGCKIYLNKRSSTFDWLKANDFIISEVSALKKDVKTDNIRLSKNEIEHNIKRYYQLAEDYSQQDFIRAVENYLG